MKTRQGNDLIVNWSILQEDNGGASSAYPLEGKDLSVSMVVRGITIPVEDFTVSGNKLMWTFYGKDQSRLGDYDVMLKENDGEVGMRTVDRQRAFTIVAHTADTNRENSCSHITVETVNLTSVLGVIAESAIPDTIARKEYVDEQLEGKVDKEDGKGLSTEDYTTEEKEKLAGIEDGAQANVIEAVKVNGEALTPDGEKAVDVTVPTALSGLSEDAAHRTVTDAEKLAWNAKQDAIADLDTIRSNAETGAAAYQKPSGGVPAADLASGVQTSLGKADTSVQPADIADFITRTVSDLVNYYTKSETYTQAEVNALLAALNQFKYEIYAALPASGDASVLYLIGPTGTGSDKYEEYVWANGGFTKIGDTSIDLSGYSTTEQMNAAITAALQSYTTTADLTAQLAAKEATANKVTSLSSESTDTQYPSAKAAYDSGAALAAAAASALRSALESGELIPALAGDLKSWAARADSPVDSISYDLIRTTGGDESIKSSGGAVLLSMACVGGGFTPIRIISSGRNLLRLRSNSGLAVAVGSGFYFPVPHLVATNDSIGTANENNGVLFTGKDGNNLKPTVYFKPLADGVPASVTDGTAATYLDKNGRRHYTTSGPGYLIVSGITWADTCAHLGWSTGYDVFTSPTDVNDAGTIVSTTGIGTLRSVGSGALMVSDTAVRLSDTQMTKTVNVGVSSALAWTDVADTDSEGAATGTYTHTATVSGMQYDGVAEIKLDGGSAFVGLEVSGTVVSFSDGNATVESGYEVKYQLATPTTSTVNVTTLFPNINGWGIEYVEATGEGQGLWQYTQGIDDAIYGLLAKREQDNEVIAEAFAFLSSKIDALINRVKSYEAKLKVAEIDAKAYKVMNRPRVLRSSVAGAPSAANVPANWDASLYGTWQGGAISFEQEYVDMASGKWYRPKSVTNTPADWVPMN